MKHGQVIFKYTWFKHYSKEIALAFRFRYDPVPGIAKWKGSYFGSYYKTPKTTNERKQWFASEGYGRPRRSFINLPEAWDDYPRADRYYDSSWKKNRKVRRQWQKSLSRKNI